MAEKRWFWDRDKKRNEIQKAAYVNNTEATTEIPPAKSISYISTKLAWFDKAIRGFRSSFYIEGGESEVGFYLTIPWLFSISITLQYESEVFKKKWPELYAKDGNLSWGFSFTRDYFSLEWKRYTEMMGNERGFHIMKDWRDLIMGDYTTVSWSKSEKVYSKYHPIATHYRVDDYDRKEVMVDRNPANEGVIIQVPISVYKKVGTWHYKRWWNIKRTRYEVESEVGIFVRGKGENSWDQDDEICISRFNPDRDCADFSCGAKTPEEAADAYIESIKRKLNR